MSNGLSLDFNRYKPKQNYTFVVEIADARTGGKTYPRLASAVTSVSLVKVPIQTIQDDPQGFGQYWNIIPVHDVDSKEMRITFEETDDMLVTSLFAPRVGQGNTYKDLWNGAEFIITVTYFNEYKYDIDKHRASEHVERYYAIVKDFQHPSFQRTGNVDKLDITVTFKVMLAENEISNGVVLEGDNMNYTKKIQERFKALCKLFYGRENTTEEIPATPAAPSTPATPATPSIPTPGDEAKTPTEEEIKEAKEAEAKKEADNEANTGSGRSTKTLNTKGVGTGTKDFTVTDEEVRKALKKINASSAGGAKVTFEQLKTVMTENAAAMATAYSKMQDILSESGLSVSVNAYNDTGHGVGLGTSSGSHLLGQKVDLNMTDSNGKKITTANMTAEQKKIIENAAKQAGLIANYETSNGSSSLWGDFSLANAKSINKSGQIVENVAMTSWTNGKVYNTATKNKQNIGIA